MPIYKHSNLQRMEITTPLAFLGLIDICAFTKTPSYNAWKLPLRAFLGFIDICSFTNTHGNYHSACLSRSYRHMPVYKHSKLQCIEITTSRVFLGLIDICTFTNTPSYNTWKLPLRAFLGLIDICPFTNTHGNYHYACLSRSYRHMPVYKHSKL
jgi:hypothetical protein